MVLQVLVESRRLARLMVAFCEVGCVASRVCIQAGRELEIAVFLVQVRGDRFAPRDMFVDLGQCRQSSGRAVGLAESANRDSMRCDISRAARRVNVKAITSSGGIPLPMSHAIRAVSAVVFPVPAPARIRS